MEVLVHARERADTAFIRSVFQGLVVFRWLTLAYATIGVVVSANHLNHPVAAGLLLGAAALVTAVTTLMFRRDLAGLTHPATILIEFAVAIVLLIGDGWVYADARPQSLPWAWPAAALLSGAMTYGVRIGVTMAAVLGVASFIGEGLNSGGPGKWGITASSKTGLYVLSAAVAGYMARRLRFAEQQVSVARAREEVARTLHDGVLQTLAVVQRRSDDPELVQLAREQDTELRSFLFGTGVDDKDLALSLRDIATKAERNHQIRVQVVVAGDLPSMGSDSIHAVSGAVTEALNNVAKHADATRTVVYVEPDDETGGVFCSVKDDGSGFELANAKRGEGLNRSIEGRVHDVGGRVEIASKPGRGTEVRLWVK